MPQSHRKACLNTVGLGGSPRVCIANLDPVDASGIGSTLWEALPCLPGTESNERARGQPSKRATARGWGKHTAEWDEPWAGSDNPKSSPGSTLHWNITLGTSLPSSEPWFPYLYLGQEHSLHTSYCCEDPGQMLRGIYTDQRWTEKSGEGTHVPFSAQSDPLNERDPLGESHSFPIHWSII